MRYFILSDIHSNVEALEACIQRAKEAGYEGVLCCGDLVGYGPNPVEAIDIMRTLNAVTIRGNHDRVAAGLDEAEQDAQLVHGAITDEDDYIFTEADANENFPLAKKHLTFFGHSHFPVVFSADGAGNSILATSYEFDEFVAVKCESGKKLFVNPGSVGQPRDGDPRASFAIWDQDRARIEFYRVEYDVTRTQQKMREAQLPAYLIERLAHGR